MTPRAPLFGLMFFASGAAGLMYQVSWQRELGLLFGNTTHSTSTTLAVFFLGLAAGSHRWGRRCRDVSRPLRLFGRLEVATGVSALLMLALLPLYRSWFGALYAQFGDVPALFLAVKFALAAVALFPAAFFMGGTLPVLAQGLVREDVGRTGTWLYAVNTFGAALGAMLAGFFLPRFLGFRTTYFAAVAVSVAIGVVAIAVARSESSASAPPAGSVDRTRAGVGLAFASGALALSLEVLWTRMFMVVLQNTVYTFGALLVCFLIALSLGAGLAHVLCRTRIPPRRVMSILLVASGVLVVLSPRLFGYVSAWRLDDGGDWGRYVAYLFLRVGSVVLLPGLVLGAVFPFLLRTVDVRSAGGSPGALVGRLLAANTIGALLGALVAGYALVQLFGSTAAVVVAGCVYLALAALTARRRRLAWIALVPVVVLGGFEAIWQHGAARARIAASDETLVEAYEGTAGSVAVVKRGRGLRLRLNRHYVLGGSAEPTWERLQTHIPLCLHDDPKSVFYIGMGTGITAGAALRHDVKRVVVTELVPEVVEAARDHFAPWAGGLFEDQRVEIITEDARTVLHGTRERYDVVIGDLFLPWKRGVGSLYTREQFAAGRARLKDGGIYAQWLPLYQVGDSFGDIAHAFAQVFDEVTVWRGDFFAARAIVALVGRKGGEPLDPEAYAASFRRVFASGDLDVSAGFDVLPFHLYLGSFDRETFADGRALNTDDLPVIEFEAPKLQRRTSVIEEEGLRRLYLSFRGDDMYAGYLQRLDPTQRKYVEAGQALFEYGLWQRLDENAKARIAFSNYVRCVPREQMVKFEEWIQ